MNREEILEEIDAVYERLDRSIQDKHLSMALAYAVIDLEKQPVEFWQDNKLTIAELLLQGVDNYICGVGYPPPITINMRDGVIEVDGKPYMNLWAFAGGKVSRYGL